MNHELIFVSSNQDCQDSIISFVSSMASSSQQFVTTFAVERLASKTRLGDRKVLQYILWLVGLTWNSTKNKTYSNSRTLLTVKCFIYDVHSYIKMQYLITCTLCLIKVANRMTMMRRLVFSGSMLNFAFTFYMKNLRIYQRTKKKNIYIYTLYVYIYMYI